MAFQWIFDNAADISMVRRPIVSQTTSRDQRIRTVSRGGNIWRFKVTMPKGLRWQENSSYIAAIDDYNILKTDYVNMSRPQFNYIMGYKGDGIPNTGPTSAWEIYGTNGQDTVYVTPYLSGPSTVYPYMMLFRAGDFIQPYRYNTDSSNPVYNGQVYSVVEDVPLYLSSPHAVKINRPFLDQNLSGSAIEGFTAIEPDSQGHIHSSLKYGSQVTWKVICTVCPTWTINPGGIISWSGAFEFAEVLQ